MKFDLKTEQKKFWKIFEAKLIENGEPFSIMHEKPSGEPIYWGGINKREYAVMFMYCLSVDFLMQKKMIRVNITIRDDLNFFNDLERNKQDIESLVRVPLRWIKGEKNPNTRRIAFFKYIEIGDTENYAETIDEILPVIMDMIQVCEKYGKYKFFDL